MYIFLIATRSIAVDFEADYYLENNMRESGCLALRFTMWLRFSYIYKCLELLRVIKKNVTGVSRWNRKYAA